MKGHGSKLYIDGKMVAEIKAIDFHLIQPKVPDEVKVYLEMVQQEIIRSFDIPASLLADPPFLVLAENAFNRSLLALAEYHRLGPWRFCRRSVSA